MTNDSFFEKIVSEARKNLCEAIKCGEAEQDILVCPWNYCEHGIGILNDEQSLDAYLVAYGELHAKKMFYALCGKSKLSPGYFFQNRFEIVDWGCGQGIASLCFLQWLYDLENVKSFTNLQKITLIDPSVASLKRARNYVDQFLKYYKIDSGFSVVDIAAMLPGKDNFGDKVIDRSVCTEKIVVHLFSNILDIRSIDLVKLARIATESESLHFLVCVGPIKYSPERIKHFRNAFEKPNVIFDGVDTCIYKTTNFDGKRYINGGICSMFSVNSREINKVVKLPYVTRYLSSNFIFDSFSDIGRFYKNNHFAVMTPFDFTLESEEWLEKNENTQLRRQLICVLNNLICRGLPTRVSIAAEERLIKDYGYTERIEEYGAITYRRNNVPTSEETENEISIIGQSIAWLEKTIAEALLAGRIKLTDQKWDVLVIDRDNISVKALDFISQIAVQDVVNILTNLIALLPEEKRFLLPFVEVSVWNGKEVAPFEINTFDLVLDISTSEQYTACHTEFRNELLKSTRVGNVFIIRANEHDNESSRLYFDKRIQYAPCAIKTNEGLYTSIVSQEKALTYFLQWIMRKVSFREGQLPILSRALQLKNVIGLLPTGGGKSLTYQLAALLQPGVTLIVDPLVSLMNDQVDGLGQNKITNCFSINSNTWRQKSEIIRNLVMGKIQLVFVAPERLCIEEFRMDLESMYESGIYFAYGVIDEVHCVSEWGHDFRVSYLHIGRNLKRFLRVKDGEGVSLFGLTATASFDVLADVERELCDFNIDVDTTIRYENIDRLELQYLVINISTKEKIDNKWISYKEINERVPDIVPILSKKLGELQSSDSITRIVNKFCKRHDICNGTIINKKTKELVVSVDDKWFQSPTNSAALIVFCPHKSGTEISVDEIGLKIGEDLDTKAVGTFVGGDNSTRSSSAAKYFKNNQLNIMVATKAFGMGIDKPNVRFIINVCHSGSLESYVQEAGRAGRDGKMALSVILYDGDKILDENNMTVGHSVHDYFICESFPGCEEEKKRMIFFLNKNGFENDDKRSSIIRLDSCKVGDSFSICLYFKSNKESEIMEKAIYRLSCLGLVKDHTKLIINSKTGEGSFRITYIKLSDEQYYENLEGFVRRYYSDNRAKEEIETLKKKVIGVNNQGYGSNKVLCKCIDYVINFIYNKICDKRKRAIDDIENFCVMGCQLKTPLEKRKSWLEINEDLKDYIYYYFNSKFARNEYKPFYDDRNYSLTEDTEKGKNYTLNLLDKYIEIFDAKFPGNDKDNARHLLGATRLIRRGLTDKNNCVIDLLNAFCLLFLGVNDNGVLKEEMQKSYIDGCIEVYKKFGLDKLKEVISLFEEKLAAHNVNEILNELNKEIVRKMIEEKLPELQKSVRLFKEKLTGV